MIWWDVLPMLCRDAVLCPVMCCAVRAGPGGTVRSTLTEPFMRRVQKLVDDDEYFTQQEY